MINANYFDYAAATPLDDQVFMAMKPYFSDKFYNPSSGYLSARDVKNDIKSARNIVSQTVGGKPAEVIFTAGGTEANNLALKGVMAGFDDGELVVSAVEHDSVLIPARKLGAKVVGVDPRGLIDIAQLENLINDKTVLVSVILVNNETGVIQDLKKISDLLKEIKESRKQSGNHRPLLLHTDASQAGNFLSLNISRLGVDMMTLNGGKIYGPKQSGVLITSYPNIHSVIDGGGQENNYRSGTENVANIVGFSRSLEMAQKRQKSEQKRLKDLRDLFLADLKTESDVSLNQAKNQHPGIISITIYGIDNERIMMELDELGYQVAVGSACSASDDEPSHVLKAMGLSDTEARSTIRISLGRFSTTNSVKKLAQEISKIC